MLTPESGKDFASARQHALFEEWINFFTGRPNDLLSFEEIKQNLRLQDSAYKGLQEVELDKIVGSTGRYRDFTRSFLPKNRTTEERWRRVDNVALTEGFPPVELYKVGDVYFVRDGNHRVSVARNNKAKTIEAYVIEYKTAVPISKDDDIEDIRSKMDALLIAEEREEFFKDTQLDKLRPEQEINFTEPGRYRLVKDHIAFHKFLKETECHCEIPYEQAVMSWYDTVYVPTIETIRRSNILVDFPDRTEADLYAWLLLHREQFEKEIKALGYVPNEDIIEQLRRERATNSFALFMGLFRNSEDLRSLPLNVERAKFLDETNLDEVRPHHNIKFTESGCYYLTKRHIDIHKYLKEVEQSRAIPYEEAVASWYDNVYMPVIELIRSHNLPAKYPKNTESDLYLWVVSRREALESDRLRMSQILTEALIEELESESASGPVTRLINYFSQKKSKISEDLEKVTATVLS
ncbi:MAG: hypothetical protein H6633_16175 [Anaerolineales bacterium]|nr:hypothetical protein [Anaerolineales bacterium]